MCKIINKLILFYLVLTLESTLSLSFLNFKSNYLHFIKNCYRSFGNCSTQLNDLNELSSPKDLNELNNSTNFSELNWMKNLIKQTVNSINYFDQLGFKKFRSLFKKDFVNDELIDKNDLKFNIQHFINFNQNLKLYSKTSPKINSNFILSSKNFKLNSNEINSNNLIPANSNRIILIQRNSKFPKDIGLEEGIKLKCYLNIIRSFKELNFLDVLLLRKDRIRTNWYRKNEKICQNLLEFKSSNDNYRFFPGLIELKYYKLKLIFFLIKWKIEQVIKFNIWFLVIIARIKQGILGRTIIRDEDINLLIRLFYPELFAPLNNVLINKRHSV